jgi:hypothetical protein
MNPTTPCHNDDSVINEGRTFNDTINSFFLMKMQLFYISVVVMSTPKTTVSKANPAGSIPMNFKLPGSFGVVLDYKLADQTSFFWEKEQDEVLRDIRKEMAKFCGDFPNPKDISFVIGIVNHKFPHFVLNNGSNLPAAIVSC